MLDTDACGAEIENPRIVAVKHPRTEVPRNNHARHLPTFPHLNHTLHLHFRVGRNGHTSRRARNYAELAWLSSHGLRAVGFASRFARNDGDLRQAESAADREARRCPIGRTPTPNTSGHHSAREGAECPRSRIRARHCFRSHRGWPCASRADVGEVFTFIHTRIPETYGRLSTPHSRKSLIALALIDHERRGLVFLGP